MTEVQLDLLIIFKSQYEFVELIKYKNEFETARLLRTRPEDAQQLFHVLCLEWLNTQNKDVVDVDVAEKTQESIRWREEGNVVINRRGENRNLLEACRLYTKAIFAAPPGCEALALAHANRSLALQKFGYYKQAYDDCVCALQLGYPNHMRHKILTRQAYCAWQLKDGALLQVHLNALEKMTLNDSFTQQVLELRAGLADLENTPANTEQGDTMPLHRDKLRIVHSGGIKGRHMIASQKIKKFELIFGDRATSFVPTGDHLICQNCAAAQLIPFPCPHCYGSVVYCSVQCRDAHACIHYLECYGYQRQLFANIGIFHLAFRMVLEGLPDVVPLLRHISTAAALWVEIVDEDKIVRQSSTEYGRVLRMFTHLHSMSKENILLFGYIAEFLVLYLKECTHFFKLFEGTAASVGDWEIITASLILRHVGQLMVNAQLCSVIDPMCMRTSCPLVFTLMNDDLWSRPNHILFGHLYNLGYCDHVAVGSFPYMSYCNHACETSFYPKFSKRIMYTHATKDIEVGEEIFNCYTLDYRKSLREVRSRKLRETYKFVCDCKQCKKANPDEDYEKFHRYRCDNKNCQQVFVPHLPDLETLNWWDPEGGKEPERISCPLCGAKVCGWLARFTELAPSARTDPHARAMIYKYFEELDKYLLDYHELKLFLALDLIIDSFVSHNAGLFLSDTEFSKLVNIVKFYLGGIAEQNGMLSVQYVSKMSFLWDLIALGKYQCTKDEMQEMLQAVEIIGDEFKVVFLNYYEDYMKHFIV